MSLCPLRGMKPLVNWTGSVFPLLLVVVVGDLLFVILLLVAGDVHDIVVVVRYHCVSGNGRNTISRVLFWRIELTEPH